MPDPIVEAIVFHENPSFCNSRDPSPLTFVHVANAIEEEFLNVTNIRFESKIDMKYLKETGLYESLPNWMVKYIGPYGEMDELF
ncbi:MAG: hypothetical protein VX667_07050 [Nitrospinota bacterium]|nr:hypothetical protein [Nitrospinota bacterium]